MKKFTLLTLIFTLFYCSGGDNDNSNNNNNNNNNNINDLIIGTWVLVNEEIIVEIGQVPVEVAGWKMMLDHPILLFSLQLK